VKLYLKKLGYSLTAIDSEAAAQLDKVHKDEMVLCEIKCTRSYPNHKRFFKFLQIAFDLQEHFTEPEHFRRWLQIEAGYYTTIVSPNGDVKFISDSISFEKMDEDEFKKLFSTVIDVFLRELGTGVTEQKLIEIIHFG
jgi:hypothetical protein